MFPVAFCCRNKASAQALQCESGDGTIKNTLLQKQSLCTGSSIPRHGSSSWSSVAETKPLHRLFNSIIDRGDITIMLQKQSLCTGSSMQVVAASGLVDCCRNKASAQALQYTSRIFNTDTHLRR